MLNYIDAKTCIIGYAIKGVKPTIKRDVVHAQGYAVSHTRNFVKVQNGKRVLYYNALGNPFHNLYRIVARPKTYDHVTHATK